MAVPQSTAMTSFLTVTWPVSVSTSTSAYWAPKGGGECMDMCDAVAMICSWSATCRLCRATSASDTLWPSGAVMRRSRSTMPSGVVFSMSAARARICSRTCSAAFFTAPPEMKVVDEA